MEGVPGRVSRESNFDITQRCAFADEFGRFEMHLSIPIAGKLTEGMRFSTLMAFVAVVSTALSFPQQIAEALNIE
jgi:hypothetical protein